MKTITLRQKKEALSLLKSRRITVESGIAHRLLGFLEVVATHQLESNRHEDTARSLAEFVRCNTSEIRALPAKQSL